MNYIRSFRRLVELGDYLLTRPIRLDGHPRLKAALMVLYGVAVLALIASQVQWEWVSPAKVWTVLSIGVPFVLKALPGLLVPLLLWLGVWAGLAVLLAGITTFCFGLSVGCQHRDGLGWLCFALVGECIIAGVLAVPISLSLLCAWR